MTRDDFAQVLSDEAEFTVRIEVFPDDGMFGARAFVETGRELDDPEAEAQRTRQHVLVTELRTVDAPSAYAGAAASVGSWMERTDRRADQIYLIKELEAEESDPAE